jgi:adenine/guanine/hypoxanthine permease
MLESLFGIGRNKTTVKKEVIAGITTWLTMVYIVAVNPAMLADAGMGLNAFFVYSVVLGMGVSWEHALGAVFWSGVLFLAISFSGLREKIIYCIPESLKTGIAVGIGLFLAVIGLENSGIVVHGNGTLLALGDLLSWSVALSALGFFIIVALHSNGKNWAVIFGILMITVLAWIFDPGSHVAEAIVQSPPSLGPTFFKLDVIPSFDISFVIVIISMFFLDLFDTSGTLVAVAKEGGLEGKDGKIPHLGRALLADSSATIAGSLLGTSTTTSYIESTSGIAVGGKTGLTSVVVALLFLGTLFFSPLASSIPRYATAPALVFVGVLLIGTLSTFNKWKDYTESAPLIICAIMMPLSFSITDGLGMGIISFTLIKVFSGKRSQVHPLVVALTILFLGKFILL